ncbi:MAG: hypothetical protein GF418_03140 [Chitinivibrionales bacterium]|nr:hypothetical protein [Chitinivibrionales bacterium]MBD3394598.1 hypothetical protein [Chitinivibrionales bacterium]
MMPEILPYVATVLRSSSGRDTRGRGVVERMLDRNTYVIRTETGRMTVRLDKGALPVDTQVFVRARGDSVDIRVIAQPNARAADALSISGRMPDLSNEMEARQFRALLDEMAAARQERESRAGRPQEMELTAKVLRANAREFDPALARMARQAANMLESGLAGRTAEEPVSRELRDVLHLVARHLEARFGAATRPIEIAPRADAALMMFSGGREALQWLEDLALEKGAVEKNTSLDQSDPALVRVFAAAGGSQQAVAVPAADALGEVREFLQGELTSPALRNVDPAHLIAILESAGAVSTERIHALDRELSARPEIGTQMANMPPGKLAPLVEHWLSVALTTNASPASLAQRAPAHSSAEIVRAYEQLLSLLATIRELPSPEPAENYQLQSLAAGCEAMRADMFAKAFSGMGFDTEQKLAHAADTQGPPPDNLKVQLLELLAAIDALPRGSAAPEARSASPGQAPAGEIREKLQIALEELRVALEHALRPAPQSSEQSTQGAWDVPPGHEMAAVREQVHAARDAITLFLSTLSGVSPRTALGEGSAAAYPSGGDTTVPDPSAAAPVSPETAAGQFAGLAKSVLHDVTQVSQEIQSAMKQGAAPSPSAEAPPSRPAEELARLAGAVLEALREFARGRDIDAQAREQAEVPREMRMEADTDTREVRNPRFILSTFESRTTEPEAADRPAPRAPENLRQELLAVVRAFSLRAPRPAGGEAGEARPATVRVIVGALGEIAGRMQQLSAEVLVSARQLVQAHAITPQTAAAIEIRLGELLQRIGDALRGFAAAFPSQVESGEIEQILAGLRLGIAGDGSRVGENDSTILSIRVNNMLARFEAMVQNMTVNTMQSAVASETPVRATMEEILEGVRMLIARFRSGAPDMAGQPAAGARGPDTAVMIRRQIEQALGPVMDRSRAVQADVSQQAEALRGTLDSTMRSFVDELLSVVKRPPESIVRIMEQLHAAFSSREKARAATEQVQSFFPRLQEAVTSLARAPSEVLDETQRAALSLLESRTAELGRLLAQWGEAAAHGRATSGERLSGLMEEMRAQLAEAASRSAPASQPADAAAARAGDVLAEGLSAAGERIEHGIAQLSRSFEAARSEFLETAARQWRDLGALVENALRSFTTAMRMAASESAQRLGQLAQAQQQGSANQEQILQEARDIVRQLSAGIQRLLERTGQYIERITTEPSDTGRESRTEQMQRALDTLLSRFGREVDLQLRNTAAEIDNLTARAALSADSSQAQTIARQIENVLGRLESLQLLARTAPSTEGQQQILSLPVTIGGERTEVMVRLVRQRGGAKGRGGGGFSVDVNVAPAFLGPVDVHMRYSRRRDLSVTVDFERGAARSWFDQNRQNLHQALQGIGFKSVSLSLRTPAPGPSQPKPSSGGAKSSEIDITI